MKKLITTIAVLASMFVGLRADSIEIDGVWWEYSVNENQVTITGAEVDHGALIIPAEINGYPVTSVASRAFFGNTGITIVVIPDSVTNVGNMVFGNCYGIMTISVSSALSDYTSALKSRNNATVVVRDSSSNSGEDFLYEYREYGICITGLKDSENITSLVIPSKINGIDVRDIGDSAFSGCSSLAVVMIMDGVSHIGLNTFNNCNSLTRVFIPDSVAFVIDGIFDNCWSLTEIFVGQSLYDYESALTYGNSATVIVRVPSTGSGTELRYEDYRDGLLITGLKDGANVAELVIPSEIDGRPVVGIASGAFEGCGSLMSVVIPDSVVEIGTYAFSYCSSLMNVVIPNGITYVGEGVFSSSGLLTVTLPNSVTNIDYYAFAHCENLASVTMPDGVVGIGRMAFCGNGFRRIVIPDSVVDIGKDAFRNCVKLTDVVIPSSVTNIGEYAFGCCEKLASVEVLDGVGSIGASAFYRCRNLTSVVLPDSVTNIGAGTFSECDSLASVIIPENVAYIGSGTFNECYCLTSIAVDERNDFYCSVDGVLFDKNKSKLVCCPPQGPKGGYSIPDGVVSIEDYAFSCCDSITSVTMPNSVTNIGYGAFYRCSTTSIVIPDGVTNISSCAFDGCGNLGSVRLPDGVANIGSCAFRDCGNLTSIVMPNSVTNIDACAFYWCSRLTRVVLSERVVNIGESSFTLCVKLTDVVIPDSVTTIGSHAFDYCSSLKEISIPKHLESFSESLKYGNSAKIVVRSDAPAVTTGNVPHAWIDQYKDDPVFKDALAEAGGDYNNIAQIRGLNGYIFEQCYVAGLEPTNEVSKFEVKIEMSGGVPVLTWTPNLNTNGVIRSYTIMPLKWNATMGRFEDDTENAVTGATSGQSLESEPTPSGVRLYRVKVALLE